MKNNITKIISVFALLLLISGCVKYNANIEIKSNKKMNFELISAISKSMMNQGDDSGSTTVSDNTEAIEKLKAEGWKAEEYEDDLYKGYKLTKTYDNIDDISSDNPNVEYDFNALFQEGKEDKYMFYKKESDNKTTYYSKIKAVVSTGTTEETDDYGDLTEEEKEEQRKQQEEMQEMMKNMMKSMDLKLTIEVPKVIKSNATSTDGNKLTWDLTKLEDNTLIEFEFELTGNSFPIIPVAIGGGIALLVIIVVVIVVSSKKKKNNLNGTISNVSVNQ